jgi:hypothetical protein
MSARARFPRDVAAELLDRMAGGTWATIRAQEQTDPGMAADNRGRAELARPLPTREQVEAILDTAYIASLLQIARCFWPGAGGRSAKVDPRLAPVCRLGGVYLLAHAPKHPGRVHPSNVAVRYVGESYWFKGRMGSFAVSAGFWGEQRSGHSAAAWRWSLGRRNLWVAFFPFASEVDQHHLQVGMRKWYEAVAIEVHRRAYGTIPAVNRLPRRWQPQE